MPRPKLAILGGPKTLLQKTPHYQWPKITKKIEKSVVNQLHENISIYDRSGIFKKFEDLFSDYHQKKHSLLFNSGTNAIHAMFVAAGLKTDDEVICPAYTFFASVTPLFFTGAKPVLCDCDQNGNIDPQEIIKLITPKTKAVLVTHMWGVPCQMDRIKNLCKKHKLLLLEDCSHAHGATFDNQPVGSFGDLAAWSLQGAKIITGGEGGILVTDNDEFYYKALLLGHYNKRCKQEIPNNHPLHQFATTGMGLKYRAHPLAITIAYEMMKNIKNDLRQRRKTAEKIIKNLNFASLVPPFTPKNIKSSWYALVFKYQQDKLDNMPIETFHQAILAEGLAEVDRPNSTAPLNLLPLFQNPDPIFPNYAKYKIKYKPGDFINAERFYSQAIKLPVWSNPSDNKLVDKYIAGIKKVIINYQDLL